MSSWYARLATIAVLLACATHLNAQVIRGTVIDTTAAGRIAAARVTVFQGDSAKTVTTSPNGNFTIFVAPGTFRVQVEALGFTTLLSDTLSIERQQRLTLVVKMGIDPLEIEPIAVVSRKPQSRLGREGFEWRKERARKTGMGRLLDANDIARANGIFVSDILRRQPFMQRSYAIPYRSPMVQFVGRGSPMDRGTRGPTTFTSEPYGSNMGYTGCSNGFVYYVNGTPTHQTIHEIDSMIALTDIAGIEIYRRPFEVPGEFGGGLYGCGAVVIWTE